MLTERQEQLSKILIHLTDGLDISETRRIEATERYEAVGAFLGQHPDFERLNPRIYTQGSFLLGTIVKPISEGDDYDIDLVFQLELSKHRIDPQVLKNAVGLRLKSNGKYRQMLAPEGRRCWTLDYAESARFHMDILPALADTGTAICITDKTLPGQWLSSDPKGYERWFRKQMEIMMRKALVEAKVEIEDVPNYKVKTPLQRAIQILKRHRDIMFENDPDNKPISMIITTLAAKAYNNEADLVEALLNIVNDMPSFIETRNGQRWVANPVNPLENFADKWNEHPQREVKFREWLGAVKRYIEAALKVDGLHKMADMSYPFLGKSAVNEAMTRLGEGYSLDRNGGKLLMAPATGVLGVTGTTQVKKHTFYGN